jgi:hypothetical protein
MGDSYIEEERTGSQKIAESLKQLHNLLESEKLARIYHGDIAELRRNVRRLLIGFNADLESLKRVESDDVFKTNPIFATQRHQLIRNIEIAKVDFEFDVLPKIETLTKDALQEAKRNPSSLDATSLGNISAIDRAERSVEMTAKIVVMATKASTLVKALELLSGIPIFKSDENNSNIQQLEKEKQYLPFLTYLLYVIPFFLVSNPFLKLLFGAVISLAGFILTTYLSVKHYKEKGKGKRKEKGLVKTETVRFTFFFAIIYLFVAAFALSQSIQTFQASRQMDTILGTNNMTIFDIQQVLLLTSFFVTAVPFFHAAITFLATDASVYLTSDRPRLVFPNFAFLLFEAVIIVFMANNVDNIVNFLKLIIALLISDIAWTVIYIRQREVVFIEWIHYNFLTIMFLLIVLQSHVIPSINVDVNTGLDTFQVYLLIFVVLASRSVCDYVFAWKQLYYKHPVREVHI